MDDFLYLARPVVGYGAGGARFASTSLPPTGGGGAARRHPGTTCPRGRMLLVEVVMLVRPLPLRPEGRRRERWWGVVCWIIREGLRIRGVGGSA